MLCSFCMLVAVVVLRLIITITCLYIASCGVAIASSLTRYRLVNTKALLRVFEIIYLHVAITQSSYSCINQLRMENNST